MTISAQLIGYPRIGPNRELKRALERRWSGQLARSEFEARIAELRAAHLGEQVGLVGSAVDDFFLYDAVLESALMFGIGPAWATAALRDDPFEAVTALARGTSEHEAWELTKWFDTNYHYVVPEITAPVERLVPLPWRTPVEDGTGRGPAWVIVGPYSLVKLSRLDASAEAGDPAHLAASIGRALWDWYAARRAADPGFRLQVDEPCLGLTLDERDLAIRDAAYGDAADARATERGAARRSPAGSSEPPLITIQFGRASADTIRALGERGFTVEIALDRVESLRGTSAWEVQPELAVACLDGRSVWPDDHEAARPILETLRDEDRPVRLVPSTSLMFLPYTVEGEDLPDGFQFAREKARTLARWADALSTGRQPAAVNAPRSTWPEIVEQAPRVSRTERRDAQADLRLPAYPTTTIGSLPQTSEVRQLRARLGRGDIDEATYAEAIAGLIVDAVAWQERMGLDVLVHGEFERTDMVEYFAERMDGYLTTHNGWVLSYGSRCVRPPILAAPPTIAGPITVDAWRVAQRATDRPVKGMLTGPVTMVNWSFRPPGVPDDRLFWAVAQPVADEVGHLIDAGARVIQVDEPAVRERWPLPTDDAPALRAVYARGVRAALAHVFNQPARVQMHTHMCYGTDAGIAELWTGVGVDVASIWYARSPDDSRIRAFHDASTDGHMQVGAGVFDVHSPHSPGRSSMADRLRHVAGYTDPADVWVNPDCGLKTRSWDEIDRQLGDMVAAARELRAGSPGATVRGRDEAATASAPGTPGA